MSILALRSLSMKVQFPVFLLLYDFSLDEIRMRESEPGIGRGAWLLQLLNATSNKCPHLCKGVRICDYSTISAALLVAMSFGSPLLQAFARAAARAFEPAAAPDPRAEGDNEPAALLTPLVPAPGAGKRRLQCVNTKAQRIKVLKWMVEHFEQRGHSKNLMAEAVRQFPDIFRSQVYNTNLSKATRWWEEREDLFADFEWDTKSLSNAVAGWRKRCKLKARPGRGRKTSPFNQWLYPLVRSDFERLRKAGVKFSPQVLMMMAHSTLRQAAHPTYGPTTVVGQGRKTYLDLITPRWVQQFTESQGIVHRSQTGKLQVSPEKTAYIERAVAFHMGQLSRGFASGELNEDLIENMDETHFVVNMDNGKTLGFRGDTAVKYADVVSGGVGITLVVKVTGGRHAQICCPMLIFQNLKSSYPIRGTPDTVAGVCYRSSPSSFMTSELMTEYYKEPRVSYMDAAGRTKIQFIDNYPGHNVIPSCTEALQRIKTELRYFPANSTHLTQPCDSFVISKIKDAWRQRWDEKKMEMIAAAMWQGDGRDGTSGALRNPGWGYFLNLAADSVRAVNAQRDERYGMRYARKAMIRCGLSLNLDGQWDVKQLTPELQEIIAKYRGNFEGSSEGLESTDHAPRPVRARGRGTGSCQTRGTPQDGDGGQAGPSTVAGRGRGRARRTAGATPSTNQTIGTELPTGTTSEPGVETTTAATEEVTATQQWISTRPGARAHRPAARRNANAYQSTFFSAVERAVADIHPGESSRVGAESPTESEMPVVLQDAQGPDNPDTQAMVELLAHTPAWADL